MKFNSSPQCQINLSSIQYKAENNIPLENANTLATSSGMNMAQHSRYRYKDVLQKIHTLQNGKSSKPQNANMQEMYDVSETF